MKNFIRFTLILFLVAFMANCSRSDVVLHDTHGQEISLSQLKNKWVIVNYWAVWCEACQEEIPELNRFYHANKDNQNILIYGVEYDNPPAAELMAMAKQIHIDYPLLVENPASAWDLDNLDMVPTTFIINPQGKVVKKIVGGVTEESLMTTLNNLRSQNE